MIKLFALLAVINGHEYIVDSGLSQSDCHKLLPEVASIELWDGVVIPAGEVLLYCVDENELDLLQPVDAE